MPLIFSSYTSKKQFLQTQMLLCALSILCRQQMLYGSSVCLYILFTSFENDHVYGNGNDADDRDHDDDPYWLISLIDATPFVDFLI